MVQTNWGVIYCPRGVTPTHEKRRRKIQAYLQQQGVSFDFVQSESPASVERLSSMFAANGYHTIVVVGGDAALHNALNGIMKVCTSPSDRPALGLIPHGYVNDFARYWGIDTGNYKKCIQMLIRRRVRRIDVGHIEARRPDGTPYIRHFLNCVNVGLAAGIMDLRLRTKRVLGLSMLSYLASAFMLLFQRMVFVLDMRLNAERYRHKVMNLCIGSARGYGMTPSAVPYNGQLDVSAIRHPELTGLFQGLWLLFSGRFLGHKEVMAWRSRHIEIAAKGNAKVSLDGWVLEEDFRALTVGIEQEAIDFIIPE